MKAWYLSLSISWLKIYNDSNNFQMLIIELMLHGPPHSCHETPFLIPYTKPFIVLSSNPSILWFYCIGIALWVFVKSWVFSICYWLFALISLIGMSIYLYSIVWFIPYLGCETVFASMVGWACGFHMIRWHDQQILWTNA